MLGGVWQWRSPVGLEVPSVYAFVRHCVGPQVQATTGPLLAAALAPVYCCGCSIINKQL